MDLDDRVGGPVDQPGVDVHQMDQCAEHFAGVVPGVHRQPAEFAQARPPAAQGREFVGIQGVGEQALFVVEPEGHRATDLAVLGGDQGDAVGAPGGHGALHQVEAPPAVHPLDQEAQRLAMPGRVRLLDRVAGTDARPPIDVIGRRREHWHGEGGLFVHCAEFEA